MWSTLEPGSSPIDWCEENYTFSPMVAEFVNTVICFSSNCRKYVILNFEKKRVLFIKSVNLAGLN